MVVWRWKNTVWKQTLHLYVISAAMAQVTFDLSTLKNRNERSLRANPLLFTHLHPRFCEFFSPPWSACLLLLSSRLSAGPRKPRRSCVYVWLAPLWRQRRRAERASALHFPWALTPESTGHVDADWDCYVSKQVNKTVFKKTLCVFSVPVQFSW